MTKKDTEIRLTLSHINGFGRRVATSFLISRSDSLVEIRRDGDPVVSRGQSISVVVHGVRSDVSVEET